MYSRHVTLEFSLLICHCIETQHLTDIFYYYYYYLLVLNHHFLSEILLLQWNYCRFVLAVLFNLM